MAKQTRVHRAIPFTRIEKMWQDGKTYEQMAKAVKRFDPKASDPTKPMRAIISRMLTVGFTDKESGKTLFLKPRAGMRAIGVGKKAPKAAGTKVVKAVKKTVAQKPGPKAAAVVLAVDATGKFIRIQLGAKKHLLPVTDGLPKLVKVFDKLGYEVSAKAKAELPTPNADQKQAIAETPVAAKAEAENVLDLSHVENPNGQETPAGTEQAEPTKAA